MQQTIDLPNPQDWLTVGQAAKLMNAGRSTVYEMIRDGRLGDYQIGSVRVLWAPQVRELAAARDLVRVRR